MLVRCVTGRCNNTGDSKKALASHAGVFRGACISSLPTRDEWRAPPKTPSWEAKKANTLCHTRYPMYSGVLLITYRPEYRTERSVFVIMCLATRAITLLWWAVRALSVDQRQLPKQEKYLVACITKSGACNLNSLFWHPFSQKIQTIKLSELEGWRLAFLWRFLLTTLHFLIQVINSVLVIKKERKRKKELTGSLRGWNV